MKFATKNLRLEGMNRGDIVDFSGVETIDQLKEVIVNNYVFLCRKCASASFCKFFDSSEGPCQILKKVVYNYIDMNIKSIETENRYILTEFIKSVIFITKIFNDFENWRGIYVDEEFNWYFEGVHPRLNSTYSHELLISISNFIKAYRVVKIDRLKKFTVFVEGDSEYIALPPIFSSLGVLGIKMDIKNSVKFINLKGKDSIQKDKIKTILRRYKEEGVSYFLIIDNDPLVKGYIGDLIRENLLEEDHYIVWDNKFEDSFSEEAILKVLTEEENEIFGKIDIEEVNYSGLKPEAYHAGTMKSTSVVWPFVLML